MPRDGAWTLAEPYDKRASQLVYRNAETGAEICVPSIWYNQPVEVRIDAMRWYADRNVETAVRKEKEGNPWSMAEARRYQQKAEQLRTLADEMERTGKVLG